jgi:hypothetical protein
MTLTQFFGAFNDNLFKQLVLLLCVDVKQSTGRDYQIYAQAIFALPFVLLSGYAGYLADRFSKRSIVVLAKVAEIGIMLAGMLIFLRGATDAGEITETQSGRTAVAFSASHAGEIDTVEQHRQLGRLHFDARAVIDGFWKHERPEFQPLVPDRQSVPVPVQNFQPVAATIAEHEQMSRQRIVLEKLFDQMFQSVETFTHVGWLCGQKDLHRRRQRNHNAASTAASTSTIV